MRQLSKRRNMACTRSLLLILPVFMPQSCRATPEAIRYLGQSEMVREAFLEAHNGFRTSGKLPPLRWSESLAELARGWVQECSVKYHCEGIRHSPVELRRAPDRKSKDDVELPYYYLGENLAWKRLKAGTLASGSDETLVPEAATRTKEAVQSWYDQRTDYTYGRWGASCLTAPPPQTASSSTTAPQAPQQNNSMMVEQLREMAKIEGYSQVMWADTEELGCEAALCEGIELESAEGGPSRRWDTFLVVCQYGPGGNLPGELPFSPTAAAHLGFPSTDPCDGPLTENEWLKWERWDEIYYPVPSVSAQRRSLEMWRLLSCAGLVAFLWR